MGAGYAFLPIKHVELWTSDSKVVSESRVTWASSVPILVFLGLSVLELGPMYATDRQTDVRQTDRRRQRKALLNASALWGRRHNKQLMEICADFMCYNNKHCLSLFMNASLHSVKKKKKTPFNSSNKTSNKRTGIEQMVLNLTQRLPSKIGNVEKKIHRHEALPIFTSRNYKCGSLRLSDQEQTWHSTRRCWKSSGRRCLVDISERFGGRKICLEMNGRRHCHHRMIVRRWLQLRFDFDSSAIRQRYDHSITCIMTVGLYLLLQWGLLQRLSLEVNQGHQT